jgi:hypothetical protein
VDGDLVSGVPKTGFKHSGTEIIIDALGAGSIIIDPSFVEKFLRTQNKTSMSVHSLVFYRKGLQGVMAATEYVRQHSALATLDHNDGSTAKENALIAAQMRLAFESGLAAIKSAIFLEQSKASSALDEIQTPLQEARPQSVDLFDPSQLPLESPELLRQQEKHDLDVMVTDEVAKNVIISQRSLAERAADFSMDLWSSLFGRSDPSDDIL